MNDFGVNITGMQGVFKKRQFYRENAARPTRTFVCVSGPGCLPSTKADGTFDGTRRALKGYWLNDNAPDTISSYDLECITVDGRDIYPKDYQPPEDDLKSLFIPALPTAGHGKGRTSYPVEPAPAKPATTVVAAESAPVVATPDPVEPPKAKAAAATAGESNIGEINWNPDRIVELFKAGTKIPDIAVAMGYPRGSGCNRTKAALKKAGLLQ